jgi:hypothetical protein
MEDLSKGWKTFFFIGRLKAMVYCRCKIRNRPRGIQFTQVQRYCWCSSLQMAFSPKKMFTLHETETCVALPNAWRRGVRCAHYSSDITTIWTRKDDVMRWILVSWTNVNWENTAQNQNRGSQLWRILLERIFIVAYQRCEVCEQGMEGRGQQNSIAYSGRYNYR